MTTSTSPATSPSEQGPIWHTLSIEEALRAQSVDATTGLSQAEVVRRLKQFGPNKFAEAKKVPGYIAFLNQYKDPMQIVLLVAAIVSILIQQWGTALILIILTLFNAFLALRQEGKAEASVAALQKMLIVKSKVRRGGQIIELAAEQLVPGDIVVLEAGDRVTADGRIIRAATLEIDESALTGESAPVPKQIEPVEQADTPLGDRVDMAYMNTEVTRGAADILVTATGMSTEVGHISGMLQTTAIEETPLTKQLNTLTRQIVAIALVALVFYIAIGYFRNGQTVNELLLAGIAFAIASIPTALPAVVTYLLAQGTTALATIGAIVKRLRSVETLGATSAINSDKTGTLTLNQMTAVELVIPGQRYTISGGGYSTDGKISRVGGKPNIELEPYFLPMALASDAVARDGDLVGDPTEGALVVLAGKGGIDAVTTREAHPRVAELPFDAAYKLMATFHRMQGDDGREVIRCFVKGAPDQLLARSKYSLDVHQERVPIDEVRSEYTENNERLGKQGLRVMAVARRDFEPASFDPSADLLSQVRDLTMLALVGIVDPPRPEVKASIVKAHSAGIQIRMITGDHAVTAAAIAGKLGIPGRAMTGAEFAALSDEEALSQIDEIGVIARVTPEHKVRLVDVLKKAGKIVAMTGDGVNDAPALKKADIGVAMGITGTDVSKEAAVMILTDDNFATIIRAVENGRALYDNLMKYIRFQMCTLFAWILMFLGAALFNILGGVPLQPLQVLLVKFSIVIFLAIGLGLGNPTPGLMQRSPRKGNEPVLPMGLAVRLVVQGLVRAASTLFVIVLATSVWSLSDTVAQTMAFATFCFACIFYAFESNDELRSVFSRQTLESDRLIKMSAWAVLLVLLITWLDFANRLFATTSLTVWQWVICIVFASAVLWTTEIEKFFRRRAEASSSAELETVPVQAAA
ncbi:MAG: HAD family hydrolase [Chloroflexi bacterium]|nr:MAG: HAD family hydrolase [Chloroflexota bacterium]